MNTKRRGKLDNGNVEFVYSATFEQLAIFNIFFFFLFSLFHFETNCINTTSRKINKGKKELYQEYFRPRYFYPIKWERIIPFNFRRTKIRSKKLINRKRDKTGI